MKTTALFLCVFLLTTVTTAQDCEKLLKENKREYFKHSMRVAGQGATLTTNVGSNVLWVTDWVARGLSCSKIKRERLTDEEGTTVYKAMRPADRYTFLIMTRFINARSPLARPTAKTLTDPITKAELFLQRADDRENFSKGEVADRDFDVDLSAFGGAENTYVVTFPKLNRNNQPIIKSLDDRIEIQYSLGSKRVVLDFKVKEIAGNLDEL